MCLRARGGRVLRRKQELCECEGNKCCGGLKMPGSRSGSLTNVVMVQSRWDVGVDWRVLVGLGT